MVFEIYIPTMTIVGLADKAVQESRERVRAAVRNCGCEFPMRRITVNLAPADLKKEGPAYDLSIALGLLLSSGQITGDLSKTVLLGELSLDGGLRHTNGILPMIALSQQQGFTHAVVPEPDAKEASIVGGIDIDVKKRLKYDDTSGNLHIDLHPGQQLLNGYDAMGYVRYRGDGDFSRQGRQRSFLIAFKDQAMKKWTKLPELVEQTGDLTGNVFTDRELASLFLFSRRVCSQNIKLGMLPVLEGENYDLMVDTDKLYETLKEFELVRS